MKRTLALLVLLGPSAALAQGQPQPTPTTVYRDAYGRPYPQGQYPQYQYPQGQYPQYQYPQGQYPQYQYPQQPRPQPQYQYQYPQYQYPQQPQPPRPAAQPTPYPQDPYGRPYYATPATPAPAAPGTPAMAQPTPPTSTSPTPVVAAPPPEPPAVLTLTSSSEEAKAAALACLAALDGYHLDVARERCGEAIAKDDNLALAHLWLSMAAASPAQAQAEVAKAADRASRASLGERQLVEGWKAWREARLTDAQRAYEELTRVLGGEKRAFIARGQFRQIALGDIDGAVMDYRQAIALDDKLAAAHNYLGFALADAGRLEEAQVALRRYAELAPTEPNAFDSLAMLALRRGDWSEATSQARKALNLDPRFLPPHLILGDALLLQGKAREARKEYALVEASTDGALHHEGALRAARSHLFEEQIAEAEVAFVREADRARRSGRPAEATETFLEVARCQIERNALVEAGRGLREAAESMKTRPPAQPMTAASEVPAAPLALDEIDRLRLTAAITEARAMVLAAVQERALAEARSDELVGQLQQLRDRTAADRARLLRGWIAWRSGDAGAALAGLEKAASPALRLAYAQALAKTGDRTRARTVMDEIAKRAQVDAETALARPRAAAWLRANP